jgi:predicted ATPase/DNA-binding CsgD family transcriptional regulator
LSNSELGPAAPLVEPLTRREREVLGLLAGGLTAPEIAQRLTLAASSVKWYIQQLYGKLSVNSRQDAVRRAQALGLLETSTAAQPAQAAPKHNLPLQVTTFFGREGEIAQVKARLGRHRLVTLAGSGGVGKTRLSLRVAEDLTGDYADGVWFVALAPLTDPALVAQTVAAVLGLRDEPGRPILDTLADGLRSRQLLIVLDNCEHVLEAGGQLADRLLRACPRVTLLTSSREPLGVEGEAVLAVPSLAFPAAGETVQAESLTGYAAVSLFTDRARLSLPAYTVTDRNAGTIARICQRLDGIPLALELAAARLRLLDTDTLAARLDDVFGLLTGGSRTALPRQQTLRATMDWSYKLLKDEERLLLQRLSVFAGGCTLEAAEAVCPGKGLDPSRVLDSLAALVDKSMVSTTRLPDADTRYYLMETVRQYAREKLQETGLGPQVRTRHRDYFLGLAEARGNRLGSTTSRELDGTLRTEIDNLRLALEWSLDDPKVVDAVPKLVLGATGLWPSYSEMTAWSKRAVQWCEDHPKISDRVFARLLAWIAPWLGQDEPQTTVAWHNKAIEISRRMGANGKEVLITSLYFLAGCYLHDLDDVESAIPLVAELEVLVKELEPTLLVPQDIPWRKAFTMDLKAQLAIRQGRPQVAEGHISEALHLIHNAIDQGAVRRFLITRAIARYHLGEYEEARDDLLQALNSLDDVQGYMRQNQESYTSYWLGLVALRDGKSDMATDHLRASLKVAANIPDYNLIAANLGLAADIAARAGQPTRAAYLSSASAAMFTRQGRKPDQDFSMDTLLPGWRAGPDRDAIQAAYDAGQAMSNDAAVAFALGDEIA